MRCEWEGNITKIMFQFFFFVVLVESILYQWKNIFPLTNISFYLLKVENAIFYWLLFYWIAPEFVHVKVFLRRGNFFLP